MARIAVVTSHPPFTDGGHLTIARALVTALRAAGHEADLVTTPQNRFGRQAAAYLATWLTDVGESDGRRIDQVISLRFPAYAVRHPRHVCWLLHPMREYYDLWPSWRARLSAANRIKEGLRRRLIHAADRRLLAPGRVRLFAISRTVAGRLRAALDLEAEPLLPPPPPRAYRQEPPGEEFFLASRLTPLKRVDLILRALATPDGAALRLAVAGEGDASTMLRALAGELGVASRVTFLGRVDEATLVQRYARARAVVFTPRDEDYGFVTAEAFASARAVVTCSDSGGATELVRDGENGFVVAPDPAAIARAMRLLADTDELARRLGVRALEVAAGMTWPAAVAQLLSAPGERPGMPPVHGTPPSA